MTARLLIRKPRGCNALEGAVCHQVDERSSALGGGRRRATGVPSPRWGGVARPQDPGRGRPQPMGPGACAVDALGFTRPGSKSTIIG